MPAACRCAHPASVDTRDMVPAMAVAAALPAGGRPGLRSLLTPPPGVKVAVSVKLSKVCRNLRAACRRPWRLVAGIMAHGPSTSASSWMAGEGQEAHLMKQVGGCALNR